MLISISGIDGAGKTTVVSELVRRHKWRSFQQTVWTRCHEIEARYDLLTPELSEIVNSYLGKSLVHAYLDDFLTDVAEQLPFHSMSKETIIADRWMLCIVAYAEMMHLPTQPVLDALKPVPQADLELYIDVDPNIARARIQERSRIDWCERIEFLEANRDAYLAVARKRPSVVVVENRDTLENLIDRVDTVITRAIHTVPGAIDGHE